MNRAPGPARCPECSLILHLSPLPPPPPPCLLPVPFEASQWKRNEERLLGIKWGKVAQECFGHQGRRQLVEAVREDHWSGFGLTLVHSRSLTISKHLGGIKLEQL